MQVSWDYMLEHYPPGTFWVYRRDNGDLNSTEIYKNIDRYTYENCACGNINGNTIKDIIFYASWPEGWEAELFEINHLNSVNRVAFTKEDCKAFLREAVKWAMQNVL